MEYHELKTLEYQFNSRGSRLWTQMNDNSKAPKLRDLFVRKHGGFFIQDGNYWKWKSPIEEKNGYWLKRVDTGEKVFFENMSELCRKNDLSIVKICEIMNGKRKSYKGWEPVELRAVKEGPGSHKNIGTNPDNNKKYEVITETAIFKNWITNEIVLVTNIP